MANLDKQRTWRHPNAHQNTKPCSYHAAGNCRFTADQCRNSHASQAPFASLLNQSAAEITPTHELGNAAEIVDDDSGRGVGVVDVFEVRQSKLSKGCILISCAQHSKIRSLKHMRITIPPAHLPAILENSNLDD